MSVAENTHKDVAFEALVLDECHETHSDGLQILHYIQQSSHMQGHLELVKGNLQNEMIQSTSSEVW